VANIKPNPKQKPRPKASDPKTNRRNILIYALAGFLLVWFVSIQVGNTLTSGEEPTVFQQSEFKAKAESGLINDVVIFINDNNRLAGKYWENAEKMKEDAERAEDEQENYTEFTSTWIGDGFTEFADEHIENYKADTTEAVAWATILMSFLPLLLIFGLLFFFFTRMTSGAQGGVMGFGKAKAKKQDKEKQTVTFKDVAG